MDKFLQYLHRKFFLRMGKTESLVAVNGVESRAITIKTRTKE